MSKQDALVFISKVSKDKNLQKKVEDASKAGGFAGIADVAMDLGNHFTLSEFGQAGKEFMEGRKSQSQVDLANLLHKNIVTQFAATGDSNGCITQGGSTCTTFGSTSTCS
ncbi:MAG: Nif11-like leader peptide family natural product precursor [Magnetococcales bacterium]|nr:Nif11-like leader peptide family natural product precursor [Magnetococcales bacterium]